MFRKAVTVEVTFLLVIQFSIPTNITEYNVTFEEDENIFVNSTISFENVTESSSTSTETSISYVTDSDETSKTINLTWNQPQSTTSFIPSTITMPSLAPPKKEETKPKECGCDLLRGECDINCCCDNDCSDSDKNIFHSCYLDSDYDPNSGLCYSPMFLYKNNTVYKVIREEKGLFCIAQDNLPERLQYTNQKIVSSYSAFRKIWNRKKQFFWDPMVSNEIQKFNNHYYKYGTPVWKYNVTSSIVSHIGIPLSIYSGLCESYRTVKFLENIESICLFDLFSSHESCSNNPSLSAARFTNLSLISNPMYINNSHLETIHEDYLVSVRTILCEENNECKETQLLPVPLNDNSLLCRKVLKSLHFVIKHNGSSGIIDAQCIIKLVTVSMNDWFMQEYKVTFEWAKNESNIFKRSGTPGYIDGKPLIGGTLVSKKVGGKFEQNVLIDKEDNQWIAIPKANQNGFCDESMKILFNDNILSQCNIKLEMNNSCEHLHKKVWNILFNGYQINASNPHQLDIFISSHGSPKTGNLKEWVPVFLEGPSHYEFKKPCPSLLSGVSYHVLYSYHGSVSKPQAKIIGILAKTITSNIFCINKSNCIFKLSTSVTFTDVSQKAESKFAKPPTIRIKLPRDFFYPFTSKAFIHQLDLILIIFSLLELF